MAFYLYTGPSGYEYPALNLTATNGLVYDFGSNPPPTDGRWSSNAGPATGFTKAGAAVNVPSPLPHSSGPSGSRPTAGSFGEGTWYNTDLSRLDLSDGFTWTNGVGGGSLVALPAWRASTAYTAGQSVINPSGEVVSALATFTSGASYSASNWSTPASALYPSMVVCVGAGIDPTGVADSTTAINAKLSAAGAGDVVYLPAGVYNVTALSVPTGVTLRGAFGRRYTGTATGGTRLSCAVTGQTSPVVLLGVRSRLENVAVAAASTTNTPGVKIAGGTTVISGCYVTGCSVGIDGNFQSVNVIENCDIAGNAVGVQNVVDSMISRNYINLNSGAGLSLQSGANENTIIQNKIEFNGVGVTQSNVLLFSCIGNLIVGNVIDRSGGSGIRVNSCTNIVISNNMLRRNGSAMSGGDSTENCHIRLTSSTGCVILGNTTAHGANDDTTGYDSPQYALYTQGNTDCRITGNHLSGHTSTTASVSDGGSNTNLSRLHNVSVDFETSTGKVGLAVSGGGNMAATSGTQTFTITGLLPLGTFARGATYELSLLTRDSGTGARSSGIVDLLVGREGGNATVTVGVRNLMGSSAFGTSGALYNVTATVATDGTSIVVTVTNTTANTVGIGGFAR